MGVFINGIDQSLTGPSSATDNAIARYDGTTGKLIQEFTSSAPTITDLGAIELNEGQLVFPATQNASAGANTLDDYEEGTWTVGIEFSGASVSVTYGTQTATYTKVGRKVQVEWKLILTSKGSSNGNLAIVGLPFTVGLTEGGGSFGRVSGLSFANVPFIRVENGVTALSIIELSEAGALSNITDAECTDTMELNGSADYIV